MRIFWQHVQVMITSNSFWLGVVIISWNVLPVITPLFPQPWAMTLSVISSVLAIAYKALNHDLPTPPKELILPTRTHELRGDSK